MSGAPLVSVLMPTRDRAGLLREAIESVQSQSFRNWELLVIDDQSTDGTRVMLQELSAQDPRIHVIHPSARAGGGGTARNLAWPQARGRYVALLDDDDLWMPGKLEQQLAVLERHPAAGWVFTDAKVVEGTETVKRTTLPKGQPDFARWLAAAGHPEPDVAIGSLHRTLFLVNPVTLSTVLMEKRLLEAVGGFHRKMNGEGYDLWLRVSALSPAAALDRVTTVYRITGSSMMGRLQDRAYRTREFDATVLSDAFAMVPEDMRPQVRERIVECSRLAGWYRLDAGEHWMARKQLMRSLRYKWQQPKVIAYLAASLCPRAVWRTLRGWGQLCRPAGSG